MMRSKDPDNFAFDDDTSDSDEDQLEVFKNKVDSITPLFGNEKISKDNEDSDESESDDGEDDDNDETEDSESESEEDISDKPKLSDEKKEKLFKLQERLAGMSKDEEDIGESESEEELDGKVDEKKDPIVDTDGEGVDSSEKKIKLKRMPEQHKDKDECFAKKQKTVEIGAEEKARLKYRETLSKMSIEDIQNLKERLGLKLFQQKISGNAPVRGKKVDFKRENKNRPREMSSKKTVGRFREVVQVAKVEKRDPRFDPLCGEFDEKLFKDNYKFVNEIKSQDLTFLKKQIREEEDPERRKSIKYLIQRTENQLRQEAQNKVKEQEQEAEKTERKDQLKAGVKPFYVSKSKQKEIKLVDQFEKLKSSGGLDNFIRKKTKKNLVKDRKKFENL